MALGTTASAYCPILTGLSDAACPYADKVIEHFVAAFVDACFEVFPKTHAQVVVLACAHILFGSSRVSFDVP